jgi:hypothetical protein
MTKGYDFSATITVEVNGVAKELLVHWLTEEEARELLNAEVENPEVMAIYRTEVENLEIRRKTLMSKAALAARRFWAFVIS